MGINRDRDSRLDGQDNCVDAHNDAQTNFDGDPLGDACDQDDDDDTLLDVYETDTGVFLSATNTGTDPLSTDSDGDGFEDAFEVNAGSDPNDAQSTPIVPVPTLSVWGFALLAALLITTTLVRTRRSASRSA